MVTWPAIIKHSNDPELTYIRSQAEWNTDAGLHDIDYDESDYLVDSTGNIFSLSTVNNSIELKSKGSTMLLNDFLGLVKAHAAQKGSCCVAKLYAPTYEDAFKIVESLEET